MSRFFPRTLSVIAILTLALPGWAFDREADSTQLVALYNSTGGPTWSTTWNLNDPMSTWHGVSLDSVGEVAALSLINNNLEGPLPDLLLPKLQLLALKGNKLRDTLPRLRALREIRFLDLSDNEMDGQLFDFDFPMIETLNLSNNKIEKGIPDFSKMPRLESLVLSGNRLDGGLPNFSGLPTLFNLRIANNLLDGPIPDFNQMPELLVLDLHSNRFVGTPPAFGWATSLFFLDLSDNNLTGFVPSFSRLSLLETLRLDNNRLSGTVSNFSALDKLMELDISHNLLEGRLPNVISNTNLTDYKVNGNNFSGVMPSFVGLNDLQRIDISNNALSDTLPDFSYLPSLMEFRADSNDFIHSNFDVSIAPVLRVFEGQYNKFSFSDLFDINGTALTRFIYAPQKPLPMPDTVFAVVGEDVVFDLIEDANVPNNTFSWYFEDEFLIATAINQLQLTNINALDQGTYHVIVKNNTLPALSLFSEDILLLIGCPSTEIFVTDSICSGDTLIVNDKPYFETGTYRDTLEIADPAICDTVFIIDLTVHAIFDTIITDTICESDQVVFGGIVIEESGFYTDTLISAEGCDSIVSLDLVVRPSFERVVSMNICAGDTLFIGDNKHTESGVYHDTLLTRHGCDSIIITDLLVQDTFLSVLDTTICYGSSVTFRGSTYASAGTYFDRLTKSNGCDSTYVLVLTVPESNVYPQSHDICQGDSIVVGTSVYKEGGRYIDSLITELGCDSIVELTLNVVDMFEEERDLMICDGDTLFFGGDTITSAGVFIDSLVARGGCDSIIKVRLNTVDFVPLSIDTTLCSGDTLVLGSSRYTNTGVYRDTLPGLSCDTVVAANVEFSDPVDLESVRILLGQDNIGSISPVISGGNGELSYHWNTGATERVLDSVRIGTYQLRVEDETGCTTSFDFLLDQTTAAYHPEITKRFKLNVFPNPATPAIGEVTVEIEGASSGSHILEVYDIHARLITRRELVLNGDLFRTVISKPSIPGFYFVKLQSGSGQVATTKLVLR